MSKTVNGTTTRFLVDTNNLTGYAQVFEELSGLGAVRKVYAFGLDLISQMDGSVSYYGYDGHGSVRYLTNFAGSVTDTYDYDAFGILINRTGTTNNPYLYCGEQFDSDLGFYFLRARYLNQNTGRFWTMDTYEGRSGDPMTLHKYLYGNANPTNRTDPTGRFSLLGTLRAVALKVAIDFSFRSTIWVAKAATLAAFTTFVLYNYNIYLGEGEAMLSTYVDPRSLPAPSKPTIYRAKRSANIPGIPRSLKLHGFLAVHHPNGRWEAFGVGPNSDTTNPLDTEVNVFDHTDQLYDPVWGVTVAPVEGPLDEKYVLSKMQHGLQISKCIVPVANDCNFWVEEVIYEGRKRAR